MKDLTSRGSPWFHDLRRRAGASPSGWHTGYGGRGEEDRFYLDLGMPF